MAPSKRKFHKTVFTVTILSQEPIPGDMEMEDIIFECTEGEYSGHHTFVAEEVDGPIMAKLLIEQKSDPGFFNLTEDGEDTED